MKRRAVTCGEDHGREFANRKRQITNKKKCLACLRPSTLEERRAYRRFRMVEEKRPDLIYPEKFAQFQKMPSEAEATPDRGPQAFRKWWQARLGTEESE